MYTAWIFYSLALLGVLITAWTMWPKSVLWRWGLLFVGVALIAPWTVHPDIDAGLAPAFVVMVFSLAFEPDQAVNAGRAIAYWLASFLMVSAFWYGAKWYYRRWKSSR